MLYYILRKFSIWSQKVDRIYYESFFIEFKVNTLEPNMLFIVFFMINDYKTEDTFWNDSWLK